MANKAMDAANKLTLWLWVMRHLPPLASVRAFEAAARHQNFTSAAAELGMTQAAVSYQIKSLEERLGTSLFRRERGRVQLSETGRRIAPLVAAAFDSLDDAFALARTSGEAVLTISCSTTVGPNWLAPRIGAFQVAMPSVAVRLHTSNALVDFGREDVDVAIRAGHGDWPGLVAHFLMRMPLMAFASPAFLARSAPVATPADVLRLTRISPDDPWWRCWLGGEAGSDVPSTAPGIRLDSQLAEAQAAIAGHGVAILNPMLWEAEISAGRLVSVLDRLAFDPADFWLVYPERRRRSPKIRAFRDWLLAVAADAAAADPHGFYVPAGGARVAA